MRLTGIKYNIELTRQELVEFMQLMQCAEEALKDGTNEFNKCVSAQEAYNHSTSLEHVLKGGV